MNDETLPETTTTTMPAVKLGTSKAAIGKLRAKYSTVPDASTADGYEEIKGALRELVPVRTGIEAKRKELVAGAVAWQKKVNSEARELTELLEAIEQPFKTAKATQDEAEATRKAEAARIEAERIEKLEAKVNYIQNLTANLLGAPLETLLERQAQADAIVITSDEYSEFVEPALIVLAQTKAQLNIAVVNARTIAEQAAQLKAQADQLAALQAQNEAARQVDAQKQAEAIQPAPATEPTTSEPVVVEPPQKTATPMHTAQLSPSRMAFLEWWRVIGSGMRPDEDEDMERFARRVAIASWAACEESKRKAA